MLDCVLVACLWGVVLFGCLWVVGCECLPVSTCGRCLVAEFVFGGAFCCA